MANGYLCYHHNDMDGKAAGFEVYNYLLSQGVKPNANMFIMRGYDEPYNENDFANKTVFIVDLSFTLSSIQKLFTICEGAAEVFWIDHHKSSIECIENYLNSGDLDNREKDRWFKSADRFKELREKLAKSTTYKSKTFGIYVNYPEIRDNL